MSRQADRRGNEPEVRISWLEEDMDRVDKQFTEVDKKIEHKHGNSTAAIQLLSNQLERLDAKVDRKAEEADEKVDGNRKILVGVLISTLSVAIAIVAQVLIMRGGS